MTTTSAADLERLHEAATHLYETRSKQACYEEVIETAVEILGLEWSILAAPAEDGRTLEIEAVSVDAPVAQGEQLFDIDEGIAGRVYRTKESIITDDVRNVDHARPVTSSLRSGLTVPVGDWGVFQAINTERDAYDGADERLVDLLMTHAATAIERIDAEAELRARKTELERQNERLDDVTSMISHDLRSPLNVAQGTLELVAEECDSARIADVAAAHERMDDMIENLLRWARGGSLIQDRQSVDVGALARMTAGSLSGQPALEVETDARIAADQERLRQLLSNLFRNCIDHCGESVTVAVRDHPDGFVVADDGPGIPPAARDTIFEPGYSTSEDGTGFGLAIAKAVADAHGWKLSVGESRWGGARFEITGVTNHRA